MVHMQFLSSFLLRTPHSLNLISIFHFKERVAPTRAVSRRVSVWLLFQFSSVLLLSSSSRIVAMEDEVENFLHSVPGTAIVPYSYEPIASEEKFQRLRAKRLKRRTDQDSPDPRHSTVLSASPNDDCLCGRCRDFMEYTKAVSPTTRKCCRGQKFKFTVPIPEGMTCILHNEEFLEAILHIQTLDNSMVRRALLDGDDFSISEAQRRKRFSTYKWTTRLLHGHPGSGVRIPLPPCVEAYIKKTFPDPEGSYTGFVKK